MSKESSLAQNPAINPFEPPKSEVESAPTGTGDGPFSDGDILVTSRDSVLPDRCLKCNRPAEGQPLKRVLYWHTPALYVLVLFWMILYAIVALIVRKKATVMVSLCAEHRVRRRSAILISWLWALGSIALMIALPIVTESGALALVGFASLIGALIFAGRRVTLLRPKTIDDRYAYLKGASPEFLHSLPRFHG